MRRTAGGVQTRQLLLLGIPNDGEQITADTAARWLHQPERCVCGNRRIDGAAARLKNVDRDLRRQRLARGRHAVWRNDFRTRRMGAPSHPIIAGLSSHDSASQGQKRD